MNTLQKSDRGDGRSRLSRRGFLRGLAGGSAAALALAEAAAARVEASLEAVRQSAGAPMSDAAFWEKIRGEFMITNELAYMNNGTLGPMPKPVFYTVVEKYRELAQDPGEPNRQQGEEVEEVRKKAAAFVRADVEEIALVRNTTEGMNFIVSGLELKQGDEVLLTHHEHPGGLQPWRLKAKRHGVVLKPLTFPIPTTNAADILNLFNDAITPRTRVISVSHATYPTGCFMPVKELAALARSKGLLTLIDGAHPLGMLQLDMHALGIDFYATSPHKWLDAPTGTGLLYMRREAQEQVWPTVVTGGWDDPKAGAKRYDRLSQRASPLVIATGAAMDFQDAIGKDRIEKRVRSLAANLRARLKSIDGVRIHTTELPELSGGLTGFAFGKFDRRDVVETLWRRNHVWVRQTDYGLNTVRVSTHYYNTEQQIERLEEGLRDILKRGVIPAPPPPTGEED